MTKIKFNEYTYLMIRIGYWLVNNNKKFTKRTTYSHGNEKISYENLKKKLLNNKTKYNTTVLLGRLAEYAIVDNTDTGFLPNFVIGSDKKQYSKNDYIKMVKWTLQYEKVNGHRPEIVDPSITIPKKYGRSTKTGCDNRGQNNGYYCGPHMLQEIIRNLTGKVIPQATIAAWAGTTSSGTGHNGIETALSMANKKYDLKLKWAWKNFSDLGWAGLKKILESTNQDAGLHELYRRQYGHYTNFDKISSSSVDVHNSLGSKCAQGCYCGYTENRSLSEAKSYLAGISQKSVLVVIRS